MVKIIRRFLELLGMCVLMSAVISTLVFTGVAEDTREQCGVLLLIAVAIFLAVNIFIQRDIYYVVRRRKIYYFINLSAYGLFMAVNFAVYLCNSQILYGFLFGITKFISPMILLNDIVGNYVSVGIFHLSSILSILILPFTMKWVKVKADKEDAERAEYDRIMKNCQIPEEVFEQAVIEENK